LNNLPLSMTRAELEKKHIAELHSLAAEAGIERYRMLPRAELIAKLADGASGSGREPSGRQPSPSRPRSSSSAGGEQRDRPPRRRRRRSGAKADSGGEGRASGSGREPRPPRRPERTPEPESPPAAPPSAAATPPEPSSRPKRRRRRRFGRRSKQGVTLQSLLLPPAGRQALLAAETREACTTLLRGIAADLSSEPDGPDPVALLIDPSPEELADWRRDAPKAEIVAAGQPRHADDALAQASARAASGDHVILLVDSLTRLGEAYEDADAAKQFFDAGRSVSGSGSLTVVGALERPASS
jgi:transcription termination factor Rho